MVPKWPKPHPRLMKVGANEGNERAGGRITHVGNTHECSCMRAIHTSGVLYNSRRRDGRIHGLGHTYALFERCGSVLEVIKLGN